MDSAMKSRVVTRLGLVAFLLFASAIPATARPVTMDSNYPKHCIQDGVKIPAGQWYTGNEFFCRCNDNGRWEDCQEVKNVTAVFDTDKLKGTISAIQGHDATSSKWIVKFDDFDVESLCPSGELNWHVHTFWAESHTSALSSLDECGLGVTGNHYDPTYGCGSASQFRGDRCMQVRPDAPNGVQTCDLEKDVSTCEIGDLSGKLGRVKLTTDRQTWMDPFATNIDNYRFRSVVLHCCSDSGCAPRVACARFYERGHVALTSFEAGMSL